MLIGLGVALLALAACGTGAVPTPTAVGGRVDAAGVPLVRRVRFEEDKVTCYASVNGGLRCLRDQP